MKLLKFVSLVTALSFSSQMFAGELDDVTMNVASEAKGHRLEVPGHNLILKYMLEHGDITQDEIDAIKEERKAAREELRTLRESGDKDALVARRTELRAQRSARVEEMRAYIANNEELAAAVVEMRERRRELLDERKERRERRARRDQREDTQAPTEE